MLIILVLKRLTSGRSILLTYFPIFVASEDSFDFNNFKFDFLAETNRQDSQKDAMRLKNDLFESYTKIVRPVRNQNDSTVVFCDLVLKQLIEVVIKKQEMTLLIWNRQAWVDQYLVWDPAKYGGIRTIR